MSQYDDLAPGDDAEGGDPLRRDLRMREGRGTTVLVMGILGLVLSCFILGIVAWVMGSGDLKEMRAGRMERRQESETRIGMILGIVSVILSAIGVVIAILFFAGLIAFGTAMVHELKPAMERRDAENELSVIASTIDEYLVATGKLPATLQDLTRRGDGVTRPLNRSDLRDPWSREYEYEPRNTNDYDLRSLGADGQSDTEDDVVHAAPTRKLKPER